ncbi:MAG: CehA/McbA family metallohydrolase [Proteobacteria bacterium]|nr:CehA/McbA family metallohydrolase [Pseudomonadota bacterium]
MSSTIIRLVAMTVLIGAASLVLADREPVLKQIDVPHDYYFREMYLPQLTSGPSALSWSPDSKSIVYSMQGSLWRQSVDSGIAMQLTAGPGYDYQPDWSPDGNSIVFVRYDNDTMELNSLDIATGAVTQLTDTGGVNVEPRWSPDGIRIAFVSTEGTGRFHVFIGDLVEGRLIASPLVEERESEISRYYYSTFDHELSPVWLPDGSGLVYVSNPEIPYGTGAIWSRELNANAEPQLVRKEETSWKARPDLSPDGKRVAYSSYLGRQWHQLWVTGVGGIAEPFPLTYGEFDVTAARWSPDGARIAYVANESGDNQVRIQDIVGGKVTKLDVTERRYLNSVAKLLIRIVDSEDQPAAARVSVMASDGRSYAPADSWMHADDGFDRALATFETQYFHSSGESQLTVPSGIVNVTVWRGMEYEIERRLLNISAGSDNSLTVRPAALELPEEWRSRLSGDVHVHMNYGGAYRNTPDRLVSQLAAEDLDVAFNLIVNKEQRVPDIAYFSAEPDVASNEDVLLMHSQEFHTSYWGHMGLLGLDSHLLVPDYAAYPGTGVASIYPDNTTIAGLAREQNAAVGYVHPFYAPPDPATEETLTNALPVDAALGLVDYYEVVGFAYHRPSAEVWYGLLNCGIRIAAAGGTDAMANYASLRGPVGINRTYVDVLGEAATNSERRNAWIDGLKAGRTMATNGPLLGLTVNGRSPGGEVALEDGNAILSYSAVLRSIVPVDHLELIYNGQVIKSFGLGGEGTSAEVEGTVAVDGPGWLLLRAWNDTSNPMIFDIYPYATTSPVYLSVAGARMHSPEAAAYFIAWIDRIRESVEAHSDYNDEQERIRILSHLDQATRVYEMCR